VVGSSNGRLAGLGWAVVGTFLPLPIACGGTMLGLFTAQVDHMQDAGQPGVPWPGGGIRIEDGPGRTRVRVPGIEITDDERGTRVRVPGIEITDVRGGTAKGLDEDDIEEIKDQWADAMLVMGSPNLEDYEDLMLPRQLDELREVALTDLVGRADRKELGILLHNPSQLLSPIEDYSLHSIKTGRVVNRVRIIMASDKETLAFDMIRDGFDFYFAVAPYRTHEGPPLPEDSEYEWQEGPAPVEDK
jgi:hypothetical protein